MKKPQKPKVGDVYKLRNSLWNSLDNFVKIHEVYPYEVRYTVLSNLSEYYTDELIYFLPNFSYIGPQEYNKEIKKIINEEMIRDIIE
jgi:hypothetical protein